MRNKISGAIGILWGGGILLYGILNPSVQASQAYQNGQSPGLVIGALMLITGLYYFFKKPKINEKK